MIVVVLIEQSCPVQGEDEDGEEHLVAQSRSQEFTVGVILTGAVLDHDTEGPPARGGGGAGGGQLPLIRAVSAHSLPPSFFQKTAASTRLFFFLFFLFFLKPFKKTTQ